MGQATSEEREAQYERQWQAQLASEVRERQALEQRHQAEKEKAYLDEINVGERAQLTGRH